MILITIKVVLYSIYKFKRMYALVHVPEIRFKITPVVLPCQSMHVLVEDLMHVFQGKITMSTEWMLVISSNVSGA